MSKLRSLELSAKMEDFRAKHTLLPLVWPTSRPTQRLIDLGALMMGRSEVWRGNGSAAT